MVWLALQNLADLFIMSTVFFPRSPRELYQRVPEKKSAPQASSKRVKIVKNDVFQHFLEFLDLKISFFGRFFHLKISKYGRLRRLRNILGSFWSKMG